jgi:hypothetical protein
MVFWAEMLLGRAENFGADWRKNVGQKRSNQQRTQEPLLILAIAERFMELLLN